MDVPDTSTLGTCFLGSCFATLGLYSQLGLPSGNPGIGLRPGGRSWPKFQGLISTVPSLNNTSHTVSPCTIVLRQRTS